MNRRRVALLVALIAIVAAVALMLPRPLIGDRVGPGADHRRILVLANPIHTDIALPPDPDVLARFGFLSEGGLPIADPGVGWLMFGWGGRSFYLETPTWADLKPGPVFRAFTVDASVMHVALAGPIEDDAQSVQAIDLSPAEFKRLLDAIEAGFRVDTGGRPMVIAGRSYGDFDLFYEAHGRFNALAGCNTWTAGVLRQTGLRTGWWNPLPPSLLWSLRAYNDLNSKALP